MLARQDASKLLPRTQSSLAVSPDGRRWVLLNASPDLGEQIRRTPVLQPTPDGPLRNSPLAAVALTNADVDHVAGLLTLREAHSFSIYASRRVLDVLDANPIFNVLDRAKVRRSPMTIDEPIQVLQGPSGGTLTITPFLVPGKIALYLEDLFTGGDFGTSDGDTIGLEVSDGRSTFHYVPGCARIDNNLRERLSNSRLVFFDGTLFTNDEMIQQGLLQKTGHRMGHISMSGDEGSVAALADIDIGRRVFIHINNSNPVLREASPERAAVESQGWEIGYDGMELKL